MTTGDKGKALIKSFEDLRLEAYLPTPKDVPTIGWGHTGMMWGSTPIVVGETTITADQAEGLFEADLFSPETCINKYVTVPLSQDEFDALACLIFNVGAPGFIKSHLLQDINAQNDTGTLANWQDWCHQDGVVLEGLRRRRLAELELFGLPHIPA